MTHPRRRSEEPDFWDNAEVLRGVLIRVFIYFLVAFSVAFVLVPRIFDSVILGPCRADFVTYRCIEWLSPVESFETGSFPIELVNIQLGTQFFLHIRVAIAIALIVLVPPVLIEVWYFVRPGLYRGEAIALRHVLLGMPILFYLGVLVGYFLVFPLTLHFLVFYNLSDLIANQLSLESYMSNFFTLISAMGIIFLLPLVVKLLATIGVLNVDTLKRGRQYAVVVLLILAAVITPSGDPLTMTVVFVPLYLLYELSVLMVRVEKPGVAKTSLSD